MKDIDGMKIYNDRIEESIADFMAEQNIDDMKKESQNIWNACLIYTQRKVFPDTSPLKMETGNKNYYDPEKVNVICDLYMYYCLMYDKEINIMGFHYLTRIPREIIIEWSNYIDSLYINNNNSTDNSITYNTRQDGSSIKVSYQHYNIHKKLSEGRESSLSAMLTSGKRNPVGIIAMLNHFYGWASPYTSDANRNTKQLVNRDNVQEIEQKSVPQLPQN